MPLISVIIPVYNGEKTIQETIESVLNQTFSDLELIIINDGSQDATLDVVSHIRDERLKVFSYPNAGVAESRNRGISLAKGDYISFIDADDLWTKDKLESQLKALQENPQSAVAYSWTKCIDESGEMSRRGSHISVTGNVYAKLLLIDFIENGSNPLIRRQALTEIGNFDRSVVPSEDRDMWLRLAASYDFVCVPTAQILYRQLSNSASANVVKQEVASLKAIEKAFTQAPASLQHLKKHSIANIYKGLAFKALEAKPQPKQGLIAARLLWHSVKNDLTFLKTRVMWKALLKILVMVIIPPNISQYLIRKFKSIFNTTTILGYLQLELF
ncbi:glycosyl transferase family A [[Phormidium ambiguum] IAM M-71]|uniref:Glycosyl transferase family A n=1 Tax=[Phormidium ambiguum] IAM M-71 TaxID=454136 RepID=A0A1U7IA64_9CYAN|nr:glycosyltransferase [Phormidium ambiguum]OKH33364.1 glycosyl transferase family A [Phormidium ambiguum IAM M-71]